MKNPESLKYSKTHEWVCVEDGNATAKVGITHHAQDTLGDITFVELPSVGDALTAGGAAGTIESVKAASDLLSPLTGVVATVNETLADAPENINSDPYGSGWLYTVNVANASEIDALLDAAAYEKFLESEG